MNKNNNCKMMHEKYLKKPVVQLIKYFNSNDLLVLKKFNVIIENKLYSEKEVEQINSHLLTFYEHDLNDNIVQTAALTERNISIKEYERILNIFSKVYEIHGF